MPKVYPLCQHCSAPKAVRPRKLCCRCYDKQSIRNLYPRAVQSYYDRREETLEELEALIAEQRANLPRWWHDHDPKGRKLNPDD